MEAPIQDLNRCLAILILKTAGYSNDTVVGVIACAKATVGSVQQWFKQLSYNEAASICYDQAIKRAFWLEIMTSDQQIECEKIAIVAQIDANYVLNYYGKVKAATKQPPLTSDRQQHYARLTDAAEKLRLNDKDIKKSKGTLIGNVTDGHLQVSKNKVQSLRNVDRLDADCLLSHLKATFFQFNDINDWESLTSRDLVVLKISDSLVKKLKEVSHGLALKGTCNICGSWLEPQ